MGFRVIRPRPCSVSGARHSKSAPRRPAPFSPPSRNVLLHLCDTALFPDDLLARLAVTVSLVRLENELEAAGFANPVLLSALLAEIPPTPEATGPAGLVEETHSNRAKGVPESSGHRQNF